MARTTKNRISERASLRGDIAEIEKRIAEIEKEQASPKCTVERYIVLRNELNALTCKRTSMRQRLTNVNRYWTNEQSYEPNISISDDSRKRNNH